MANSFYEDPEEVALFVLEVASNCQVKGWQIIDLLRISNEKHKDDKEKILNILHLLEASSI